MKKTFRQKLAGKFGRIEHFAGRFIGVCALVALICLSQGWIEFTKISLLATFISWIVYLGSHTIEKKLYGPGLRK